MKIKRNKRNKFRSNPKIPRIEATGLDLDWRKWDGKDAVDSHQRQLELNKPLETPAGQSWAVISKDPKAVESLRVIERAGCDPGMLLGVINAYAASSVSVPKLLKRGQRLRSRVVSLRKRLNGLADEIEQVTNQVMSLNNEITLSPAIAIREYENELIRLQAKLTRPKLVNRDDGLLLICTLVRMCTGKPHFKELADLINARMREVPNYKIRDEDALLKAELYAKRTTPWLHAWLRTDIEQMLKDRPDPVPYC